MANGKSSIKDIFLIREYTAVQNTEWSSGEMSSMLSHDQGVSEI